MSGVGAVPWLERADGDGDGAEELGVGWNSLAGEAGAAAGSGTAGLSCPAGMVLDGDLCKTPKVETVPVTLTCTQPGYVLVSAVGELGTSHSCQKTVAAYCTGAKILHQGQCRTRTVEQRDARWSCSEGTLVSTFLDPGYSYSCRITVSPPTCPDGESYRSNRCEEEVTYHRTRGYVWSCNQGTKVRSSGDHGVAYSCRVALSPPTCPDGESYRNNRCEEQQTYHRTRGYTWTCNQGTKVRSSGDHGVAYSCRVALSPPTCPDGETYRTSPRSGCYDKHTYYDSRPHDYSCPSGYTLGTSGLTRTCTKTETYRVRRCAFDPFAGRQCWWETRTRTLTAAVRQTCPSGFSSDGTGCTADDPSTRWVRTTSTPTRYRYDPAAKSCPRGWSDNGSLCQSDTASTRWVRTTSTPTRYRYDPAAKSCPRGYSDNGSLCQSDTAMTRWVATGSTPVTSRAASAVRSCDTGFAWNDTSGKCENTAYGDPSAPRTKLVGNPPTASCRTGYDPAGGGRCSKTTLGDPTAAPLGAGCIHDLGSLAAGTVTRAGTLATGCASLRKGDAQSPHWARRYTLRVPAASTAAITASSSAADVFLYMLSGSGTTVTEIASDDDSGTGTDAALAAVRLAVGTVYTVEVTTSAANVTGAFALTVTVTPDKPPVAISSLADTTVTGQHSTTAAAGFTVEPATAACTAAPAGARVTAGRGGARTVAWTAAAPFSQQVTVRCTAAGRSPGIARATLAARQAISSLAVTGAGCKPASGTADYRCTVPAGGTLSLSGTAQGPSRLLSLAWTAAVGAKIDSQSQAKTQTAAPDTVPVVYSRAASATISCTKAGTVTLTATTGTHTRSVRITVACKAAPPAVACDDPLGTLGEGVTARSGTIAADRACTSAHRPTNGGRFVYWARRHTFTLSASALVTVDLAGRPPDADRRRVRGFDAYLIVIGGHSATARPVAYDDNSGPRNDSRIARRLPAGDYTIEATTYRPATAGAYSMRIAVAHDKHVKITGLADTAASGAGTVPVTADFAVAPAAARCTAAPAAASVTVGKNPTDRTLTARIAAPGSLAVTVTCTAAGHADAAQTVTLTAKLAAGIATIGARAVRGGECKTDPAVPDAADAAYVCTMAEGGSLQVEAEATATAATLAVAWTATGGVTVDSQTQARAVPVVGPDSTTLHRRTAAAALRCTTDGTATAAAKLGASTKTALLTVTCQPPVQIHGLADTAATGTGKVTVTRAFTVTPAAARCSAEPDTAAVAKGTDPEDRTLSAKITAPDSLKIAVTCRAAGYAAASQTVTLSAEPPCSTHLGTLATGRVQRTGNITADTACTTAHRGRSGTYYTARHTFTLDSPGWVTVDIGNDASNARRLDTYLILLKGTGPAATVIGRDDDSGPRTDSRLADVFLQPSSYTIEATTYRSRTQGSYRLSIDATVTGLKPAYDAVVGRELKIDFELGKFHATATASHTDLTVKAQRAGTTGTLRLVSTKALARTVTLSFSKTAPAGALRSRAADAEDDDAQTATFGLSSACDDFQFKHPEFGTCEWDEELLEGDRNDRYVVTPALLNGVYRVANRVIKDRDAECDMTATQLAALMLSIGLYETDHRGDFDVPRSLMFLSRTDNPKEAYAGNVLPSEKVLGKEPKRAFWHPGVGYWQLDIWAPELNHAERADVDLAGAKVAKHLDGAYCGSPGGEAALRRSLYISSWNGCRPIATDDDGAQIGHSDGTPIRECFNAFRRLYLGGGLGDSAYKGIEGLWVTTETKVKRYENNETHVNPKGGVQPLKCRWGDAAVEFGCWLYDTDMPEGSLDVWDREGDGEPGDPAYRTRLVCQNRAKECPEKEKVKERYKFRSPLAAPFVSFTHSSRRFAVFPESFNGGTVTWFKHVPTNKQVRKYTADSWHREVYDIDVDDVPNDVDDVLKAQDTTRVLSVDPVLAYAWVDVAASDFRAAMRRRYPCTKATHECSP